MPRARRGAAAEAGAERRALGCRSRAVADPPGRAQPRCRSAVPAGECPSPAPAAGWSRGARSRGAGEPGAGCSPRLASSRAPGVAEPWPQGAGRPGGDKLGGSAGRGSKRRRLLTAWEISRTRLRMAFRFN